MKTTGLIRLLATMACVFAVLGANAAGRTDRVLGGWRFAKGEIAEADRVSFDDANWPHVTVPHTWNAKDGADGGGYYRGPGWYRTHFRGVPDLRRKSVFIRFEAASLVAQATVNGHPVGEHRGGFGAFCFDVTPYLNAGDNVLAVRVDNTKRDDVPPLSGDFTVYGGLYRPVHLIVQDEVGISPTDDAGPGVYLTPKLEGDTATVDVRTVLRSSAPAPAPVTVRCLILDLNGMPVANADTNASIPAGERVEAVQSIAIPNPHRWDGVRDPYLYHARVQVVRNGRVVDEVTQPLGLRTFRVDPEKGLILNDRPYDMHGVNLHQGRPTVGWAATRAMQDEDYALIHELGAQGVRLAHYQHADHEYELCDLYGLAVWAELALVNHATDSPEFFDNTKAQLRELVKQNYNHPSILFWSLYNEPAIEKRGDGEWRLVRELNDLAHQLDPNRLTTGAAVIGVKHPLNWAMDEASFNRYYGWYGDQATDAPAKLDQMRKEADGRSFGMSEYGGGASVRQHATDPSKPDPGGRWHPEEYQAKLHEAFWPALAARDWIWCKLLWVMFDFPSDGRREGDHLGINDKGLVTGDRKTKKDAFYYYQANWSAKPMVAIASRRYSPRPSSRVEVKVYSNCDAVELRVGGRSLGTRQNANHVFTWPDVDLKPGDVRLEAVGTKDGKRVRDAITWTVVGA